MIEVLLSVVVLAVVMGAAVGSLGSFRKLNQANRELALAYMEASRAIEEIKRENFEDVFATYNESTSDDPTTTGTESSSSSAITFKGNKFSSSSLAKSSGTVLDNEVGTIRFPVDGSDATYLREDLDLPEFGLPRDLNGDGVIDSANRAADFVMLPMIVRVEWTGSTGDRAIEIPLYLYSN